MDDFFGLRFIFLEVSAPSHVGFNEVQGEEPGA
jgi:hypothetical protein